VVFIGPESNGCLAKGEYVRYYYITVQRLAYTSSYYPEDISKSSVRLLYYSQGVLSFSICQVVL
jgi:hypothetical protein